jgi:hypothetical protein
MPKFHCTDPYTKEWWEARLGIPTASQFHRIITPGGKPSGQAREYLYTLVAERLMFETSQHRSVNTSWVERGNVLEPHALKKFEQVLYNQKPPRQFTLQKIGFITTDDGRMGCSPDALITGSVEAVEVKCPASHTHIGYLLDGPGTDYKPQVQGQLLIGEFDKIHFFSYHPCAPYYWAETGRDDKYIGTMDAILDEFCHELDRETERARRMGNYLRRDNPDSYGEAV